VKGKKGPRHLGGVNRSRMKAKEGAYKRRHEREKIAYRRQAYKIGKRVAVAEQLQSKGERVGTRHSIQVTKKSDDFLFARRDREV